MNIRNVVEEVIAKSFSWGYFDGSAPGESKVYGAGGKFLISDDHFFTFKAGLGFGTNNYAELCALKLLLSLAWDNHIKKLQIYGDSQFVINWVNGKFRIQNLELSQVLMEVNRLLDFFELVDLKHIYRERNSHADALEKAGVIMTEGLWYIK